jgi:hypothetical protein
MSACLKNHVPNRSRRKALTCMAQVVTIVSGGQSGAAEEFLLLERGWHVGGEHNCCDAAEAKEERRALTHTDQARKVGDRASTDRNDHTFISFRFR